MTYDFLEDKPLELDDLDVESFFVAAHSPLTEGDAIEIGQKEEQQAVNLGLQVADPSKQWQVYRNALALFGFINWLQDSDRVLAEAIDESCCSIFQPAWAATVDAACNVQIGDFKVCLIASEDLFIETVAIPKIAVSNPALSLADFAAHFYVVVGVQETDMEITVCRFLTCIDLQQRLEKSSLQQRDDWNYEIPLDWFERDLDRLLLYLRFLTPQAFKLLPSQPFPSLIENIQIWLKDKLEELQIPGRSLEQVLNWQQGAQIIGCLPLLELVNLLSTNPKKVQALIKALIKTLLTPQNSWTLLTPPEPVRSLADDFDEAIAHYQEQTGIQIPLQAEQTYQELETLRLQVLRWPTSLEEYTVAAFLMAKRGEVLQIGTSLWIVASGVWSEEWVQENDSYIATVPLLVSREESILVKVRPPNDYPSSLLVNLARKI